MNSSRCYQSKTMSVTTCVFIVMIDSKGKKEVDLYSAFIVVPHTQGARYGSHSVTCKLHRTCLYLVSIHQMAYP